MNYIDELLKIKPADLFATYQSVEAPDTSELSDPSKMDIPEYEKSTFDLSNATQKAKATVSGFNLITDNNKFFHPDPIINTVENPTESSNPINVNNIKGKKELSDLIDSMGISGDKKDFMMKVAYIESRYNSKATSNKSSASGLFQFVDGTRRSVLSGYTRSQFLNDPKLQIQAASRYYDRLLNQAKNNGTLQAGLNKGYKTPAIIAGMWLAPAWARNYFVSGINNKADANGTSVRDYVNKYNRLRI